MTPVEWCDQPGKIPCWPKERAFRAASEMTEGTGIVEIATLLLQTADPAGHYMKGKIND